MGNPTADEIRRFKESGSRPFTDYGKPVVALLCGSRLQEIKDNLPSMLRASSHLATDYQLVVAGAPGVPHDYYDRFVAGSNVEVVYGKTYELLSHSRAALVTSGTATLETALFRVPQVVCYSTPLPWLVSILRRLLLKVKYVSLVNLIADEEVVPELVADSFTVENVKSHLDSILFDNQCREKMLEGYEKVARSLGDKAAPDNAAMMMKKMLTPAP